MYRPSQRPSFRFRMLPSPFARRFGMVSAPFATNNTVTKGTKLPESRTVIRKLSFALRPRCPNLCLWRRNFCAAGGVLFSYSGAIFERPRSLSIDYSGAKYVRSALKIAAAQKSLFRVVENGNFLNRLRKGHLEKSATAGSLCPSRSPKTAKTPRKVHLRLRFQNPGKPRTAGL